MMSTLPNISGKIDPRICEVFNSIDRVLTELNIQYIVVGATRKAL